MKIEDITIGDLYEDTVGLAILDEKGEVTYNGNGEVIRSRANKRVVHITDKTKNSIEYRDGGGFMSWITLRDFTEKNRFIKI